MPLTATFTTVSGDLDVLFDKPLQAGALDASNWTLQLGNQLYNISGASASGSTVTLTTAGSSGSLAPDFVEYDPPPDDVLGVDGSPVNGFSLATITVV